MNVSQPPETIEPRDYVRALRRRWWMVVGLLVLGGLASAAYVKVAPRVYLASASVYVTATGSTNGQVQGGQAGGPVNMDSEAQVAQSTAVATIAARLMRTSVPPATLSKQLKVTVPATSQILQIGCQQPSPESASACAQAFAEAYLKVRVATATGQVKATLTSLRNAIDTLQRNVAGLTSKIATLPPNSSARASDQAQLKSDQSRLKSLNNQVGVLTAELASPAGGQIVANAAVPSRPNSPRSSLVIPSGLAAGLLLGLAAAFAADRRDQRVREATDLERRLDLPVLLTIAPGQRRLERALAAPRTRLGRAFAEVVQETSAALGDGNHILLVASASAGAGGSVTAANLAAAFARTHAQVVLVCAGLEASVAPSLFGLGNEHGVADVLAGAASLGEAVQCPPDLPRLRVLPPGAGTCSLADGFRENAAQLFSDLRRSTPIVIIEGPSASENSDTLELAEFADAALVVVQAGKTRWPEAGNCIRHLGRLRTMVLGAVLIPPAARRARTRPANRPRRARDEVPHAPTPAVRAPASPPGGGNASTRTAGRARDEPAGKGARG